MQKRIFSKLFVVSLFGIILSGIVFFLIQTYIAKGSADAVSASALSDAADRINSNQVRINEISEMMQEDNIDRANAMAMLIEMKPDVIKDKTNLSEIAAALSAEEIHIIDENGILRWGTQPERYGMDFKTSERTRFLMDILEDPALEVSQAPMPDAVSEEVCLYAGVSLRNAKGIVLVGVIPHRLLEALEEAEIGNTVQDIPVGKSGYIFTVSTDAEHISYHPNPELVGKPLPEKLKGYGFLNLNGEKLRYYTRNLPGQLLVAALPISEMYAQRTFSTNFFLIFIINLFIVCSLVVNAYIKKNVIAGIMEIVDDLEEITAGNLDKNVDTCTCEEFERLSGGINHMLTTIKVKMLEISQLADNRAQLGAIVAMADAGVIVKDKDDCVKEWNIGAENILGYRPGEAIGKPTNFYVPESEYDCAREIEERLKLGCGVTQKDVVRKRKDGKLIDCSSSYTPIFGDDGSFAGSVVIFHDISDKKRMERALTEAVMAEEEKNNIIISGMNYAKKIQRNLLPDDGDFKNAFMDYSVILDQKDIVGGDIYWLKSFDEGTILCVCDCTGHGTPGALLTMLVVSAFETIVNEYNYKNTAEIMWRLDKRLVDMLRVNASHETVNKENFPIINDGCDLAVLYVSQDGRVTVSSGNMPVFVCDGKEVRHIKGQRLYIGEGKLEREEDVNIINIPANPDNKFYIASDGLFGQLGGEPKSPFGYKRFKKVILENHGENQTVITEKIWEAFEEYRGSEIRRDDFELVTFKPKI